MEPHCSQEPCSKMKPRIDHRVAIMNISKEHLIVKTCQVCVCQGLIPASSRMKSVQKLMGNRMTPTARLLTRTCCGLRIGHLTAKVAFCNRSKVRYGALAPSRRHALAMSRIKPVLLRTSAGTKRCTRGNQVEVLEWWQRTRSPSLGSNSAIP